VANLALGGRFVKHAVALVGALILLAGCSARRGEPLVGRIDERPPAVARGHQVFMANCHSCHPGGEAGLAPAINNKPLPGFMIKTQVRLGVGAMPRFSSDEISAEQLDDLVTYLKALRRQG
jgi:mono/diheme cytochrome c family protein